MSDAKSPPDLSIDEILATIRRIITEDEQPGSAPGGGTAGAARPGEAAVQVDAAEKADDSDDILELTEALNEDGTTRHLAPIGGGAVRRAPAAAELAPVAAAAATRAAEPPPQRREVPTLRVAPSQPEGGAGEPLLPRDLALGGAAKTLEDLVREELRPLLEAWLDENLPPLIERLVRAEIARTAREAGAA